MLKVAAAIVGAVFFLAGVGAVVLHYLLSTSGAMKFVTLAIAAVLLVAGLALFNWGKDAFGRGGGDGQDGPQGS